MIGTVLVSDHNATQSMKDTHAQEGIWLRPSQVSQRMSVMYLLISSLICSRKCLIKDFRSQLTEIDRQSAFALNPRDLSVYVSIEHIRVLPVPTH